MVRGRSREEALFPVAPMRSDLPKDYAAALAEIKDRVRQERLRVVLAANSAMVLLYWDIGRVILDRQAREGWGARVIDRLAEDLQAAFPEMRGLSPRNLKYMRAFAGAWPDPRIVQRTVAQLPWRQNITLLERPLPRQPASDRGWKWSSPQNGSRGSARDRGLGRGIWRGCADGGAQGIGGCGEGAASARVGGRRDRQGRDLG